MSTPLSMDRGARTARILDFNEAVRALVDFAVVDGEMHGGRRSRQTNEAAKWLRAKYREAVESAP